MDCEKIGRLIYELRKERDFTQLQLANRIHVSDKAVSKWERGMGCPDISLLPVLCETLGIDMETLLAGEIDANDMTGGNMKKEQSYLVEVPNTLLAFMLQTIKGQSRNTIKHLLSRGQVLIDGTVQRQFDLPLQPGQTVTVLNQAKGELLP